MKAKLLDTRHGNREIPLDKLPILLGRAMDAGIQVQNCFASRRHCEISERDGALFVQDLGSKNGSLINGNYADEAWLTSGDTLCVGTAMFVVAYESSEEWQNAERTLDKRPVTAEGYS